MKKAVLICILSCSLVAAAQTDLSQYLTNHAYSFSIERGFEPPVRDSLKQKLAQYKIILQAEGGSHYLDLYRKLPFLWIRFLNQDLGMKHFFIESGHSTDLLINRYLQTGDSTYRFLNDMSLWDALRVYNAGRPAEKRVSCFGIDFEMRNAYVKALKQLLPKGAPPEPISAAIQQIRAATDTLPVCDDMLAINNALKEALLRNRELFIRYLGDAYQDFEKIVLNNGNCKDAFRNRNWHMAENFLSYDHDLRASIYYGELGEAHTVLVNPNFASILNNTAGFQSKVAVINLYCYNCHSSQEQVSNWPLHKIEKDLIKYFLPYCHSDLTLFDLSENVPAISHYKSYGDLLIIAKNQN